VIREKSIGEAHMASKAQPSKAQRVQVVEADILDTMTETMELVAQRAYEIYLSRGGAHGSAQDDWFQAEGEILPKLEIDFDDTDSAVQFTAQVPGFDASDLEVVIGHRRAVICGIHYDSNRSKRRKVMRIIELPFNVDPGAASATLQNGILRVVLPRS
jgi:HSP20 family molecular chaperone IbpA